MLTTNAFCLSCKSIDSYFLWHSFCRGLVDQPGCLYECPHKISQFTRSSYVWKGCRLFTVRIWDSYQYFLHVRFIRSFKYHLFHWGNCTMTQSEFVQSLHPSRYLSAGHLQPIAQMWKIVEAVGSRFLGFLHRWHHGPTGLRVWCWRRLLCMSGN